MINKLRISFRSDIFQGIDDVLEEWNVDELSDNDCLKLIEKILDESDDEDAYEPESEI